jgi:hypothetical protein
VDAARRRHEVEMEVVAEVSPHMSRREEKPFVKTGGVFVGYPDARPRRGVDSLTVARFPHQDSDGASDQEIAEAKPVVERAVVATVPVVRARAAVLEMDVGLVLGYGSSPSDEEEVVGKAVTGAAAPTADERASEIPAQNMQPQQGFFARLLRKCFPDRRVIPVGNLDDEGR